MAELYSRKSPKKVSKKLESRIASNNKKKKTKSRSASLPTRQEIYRLIGQSNSLFSSFVARPKKFNFETKQKQEETILLLRRHVITQLRAVLIVLLMAIAPLFLTYIPLLEFLPPRFRFISVLMWYLLVFAVAIEKFLSWYFNVNIITDERILDIDFYNLIYKEITDAEIENIEDVTMTVGGVMQTVFNYGNVSVQTAAEVPQIEFEQVPNPGLVVQVLKNMQLEEKQETLEGRIR